MRLFFLSEVPAMDLYRRFQEKVFTLEELARVCTAFDQACKELRHGLRDMIAEHVLACVRGERLIQSIGDCVRGNCDPCWLRRGPGVPQAPRRRPRSMSSRGPPLGWRHRQANGLAASDPDVRRGRGRACARLTWSGLP